ncbi:MAG TPA: hypothetical protein VK656_02830, partial [Candidatus Acidoferrum sp.]|nr:hypothetical protein [Candidatus Acidoferrum sp.]
MSAAQHGPHSEARDVVLGRIRAALTDGPRAVAVPRDYEVALPAGTDIAALFVDRVSHYRATVERTTRDGIPAAIAGIIARHDARGLVVPAGLPVAWIADVAFERFVDDPPLAYADLDRMDGVITGCAVGIAETGTIVLDAGPDQGRR